MFGQENSTNQLSCYLFSQINVAVESSVVFLTFYSNKIVILLLSWYAFSQWDIIDTKIQMSFSFLITCAGKLRLSDPEKSKFSKRLPRIWQYNNVLRNYMRPAAEPRSSKIACLIHWGPDYLYMVHYMAYKKSPGILIVSWNFHEYPEKCWNVLEFFFGKLSSHHVNNTQLLCISYFVNV